MRNFLIKLFGWQAALWQEDVGVWVRWQWLRKNLRAPNQRTLDAGCGAGTLTLYVALQHNEVIGLSYDATLNAIGIARANLLGINHLHFQVADLRQLDTNSELGLYDQIICFETIEHILNDQKLITDLSHLLKPGGRLLLTTPYQHYKHLWGEVKISEQEDGGHVRWGYTFENMRTLFSPAGLLIVKTEFIGGYLAQMLLNLTRAFSHIHPYLGTGLTLPLRLCLFGDDLITKWLRYPYLNIAVIGEKM